MSIADDPKVLIEDRSTIGRIKAGSTLRQIDFNIKTPTSSSGSTCINEFDTFIPPDCTWSSCDPNRFNLRIGPDYTKNKLKQPSQGSLMNVVGVEFLQSTTRIDDIGSKVELPSEWTTYNSSDKQHRIPVSPLLILNFQFPSEIPNPLLSLFSAPINDGPGFSVVLYCRLNEVRLLLYISYIITYYTIYVYIVYRE
jgi:hypothetical protein